MIDSSSKSVCRSLLLVDVASTLIDGATRVALLATPSDDDIATIGNDDDDDEFDEAAIVAADDNDDDEFAAPTVVASQLLRARRVARSLLALASASRASDRSRIRACSMRSVSCSARLSRSTIDLSCSTSPRCRSSSSARSSSNDCCVDCSDGDDGGISTVKFACDCGNNVVVAVAVVVDVVVCGAFDSAADDVDDVGAA